jgi:ferritin
MLSESMLKALNAQITQERFASITYQQMACWFSNRYLHGFHEWTEKQSKEENEHACKFIEYILHQQGQVKIENLEAPTQNWNSPKDVFEDILALEQKVTALINNLMKLAIAEGDFATQNMLQCFIDEQIQSEYDVNCILQKLIMIGDDNASLLVLDDEMAECNKPDTTIAGFDLNDI